MILICPNCHKPTEFNDFSELEKTNVILCQCCNLSLNLSLMIAWKAVKGGIYARKQV